MKRAGPELVPSETTKSVVPLKTAPVGLEGSGSPCGAGMVTTSDWGSPAALYNVERPVPLSATHHGVVGPAAIPQALTRFGSVWLAVMAPSETRLWTL